MVIVVFSIVTSLIDLLRSCALMKIQQCKYVQCMCKTYFFLLFFNMEKRSSCRIFCVLGCWVPNVSVLKLSKLKQNEHMHKTLN